MSFPEQQTQVGTILDFFSLKELREIELDILTPALLEKVKLYRLYFQENRGKALCSCCGSLFPPEELQSSLAKTTNIICPYCSSFKVQSI